MAGGSTNGGTVTVALPEDLDAWLDEQAEGLGLEREVLFQRVLAAFRAAATAGEEEFDTRRGMAALDERIGRLERDHERALKDVRKRVLQLKNATQKKADVGHEHEAFDRVEALHEQVETLADRVDELSATTEELANRDGVTREEFDDIEDKLSRVARTVVGLRRSSNRTDGDEGTAESSAGAGAATPAADADAADRLLDLKRLAAREGYETATCAACGESSHVTLLPEPACPACGAAVYDLVEKGRLRKKPILVGRAGDDE